MVTKLIASCVIVGGALLQYGTASAAIVGTIGPPTVVNPIPGVDPPIDFTFNIGGNIGFGSLLTTAEGGGQFLATSGTLTVTGGADIGTYTLYPGGPGPTLFPGAFIYDNLVMPGSNPSLDMYGLLFSSSGKLINIWGNSFSNYSFVDHTSNGYGVQYTGPGVFTATVVPLPASYTLLLGGLGVIGLFALRKGRKSAMIFA
jgi:PEP-CTERM motif